MSEEKGRATEASQKKTEGESRRIGLVETFKHPLVLLIIGSALTYLVLPAVTTKINHRQALRELKLKKASEIGLNHTEFNSKFNVLKSILETFHDNEVDARPTREEFKQAQKELIREFNARRFALAETEWWWYRDLQRETTINKLVPPGKLEEFNDYIGQYGQNIASSHEAILPLWRALKSPDYTPGDKTAEENIARLRETMQKQVQDLEGKRTAIIDGISRFFMVEDT